MPNILDTVQISGSSYDLKDKNAPSVSAVTQQEYDNLPSSAKTSNTFFVITDATAGDLTQYWTSAQTNSAITQAVSGKVNTSSVVSSVTSASTDNEIPTAKAVYDAVGQGGGGKAIVAGRGIAITTGETADTVSFNLPISAGTGSNSIIMGNESNIASGNRSFAGGGGASSILKTSSTKECSFAFGSGVNAKGLYSAVFGAANSVEANGTFAAGYSNYIYGNFGVGFGQRVIGNNQSETSLGNFNVSNKSNTTFGDSGNTLFSVGNGTANDARHNAFEIRQNGDIYITLNGQDVKLQDNLGGGSITVSSAITSGDTNAVAGGAVYNKFDEVEQVTAAALNDLNDAFGGLKLVKLTQSAYNALSPNYDSNTLYIIVN